MATVYHTEGQRAVNQAYLPVEKLFIDHAYQRNLSDSHIRKIAKNGGYDEALAGILIVSKRRDGRYAVIDGQHRWELAKKFGVEFVRCDIYEGMTQEEEARRFLILDSARPLAAAEKFNARRLGGDGNVLMIERILEKNGCSIPKNATKIASAHAFRCVSALEAVYDEIGADNLSTVIRLIVAIWPDDKDAYTEPFVRGLGIFVQTFADKFNEKEMVAKLRALSAWQVIRRAKSKHVPSKGASLWKSMNDVILEIYDNGRRTRRLVP